MEKNSQKQGMWQDEKPQNGALLITFVVSIFPPPPWSFWGKLTLLAANTRNHQTPKINFPYFSAPGKPATPIGMAARVIEPGPFTVQAGALSSPTPWAGRSYGRRFWFPAVVEKDEKVHLLMAFGVIFDYLVQQSVGSPQICTPILGRALRDQIEIVAQEFEAVVLRNAAQHRVLREEPRTQIL